ncbi:MAG: cytochrome c1 [Tistlia sp.]|uniref:cytochrome c1 n=1 Tax=Tistlia sp. TaxID=3057121 RepID=UPI0034A33CB5
MRKPVATFALAAALALGGLAAGPLGSARAAGEVSVPSRDWSFDGLFGAFDPAAMQRGLQVYKDVCASCHGLRFVAFRNLQALGYDADQVAAIAADFEVEDGPDGEGEMFMRPAVGSDTWPSPFPNEQAARVANGGAYPPDLSLIVEARGGGADYLHHLLIGYTDPPADLEVPPGQYYNDYFPGNLIAMPPPLMEGIIEYADGTPATPEQMAADVTTFLAWAAEPQLVERKRMGIKVILFLLVLTGLLYAVKRKVWSDVPH